MDIAKKDPDISVRQSAVIHLHLVVNKPFSRTGPGSDRDQFVGHAAKELGILGNRSLLPVLETRLNDPNALARSAAHEAVEKLGGKPRWIPMSRPDNLDYGRWVL